MNIVNLSDFDPDWCWLKSEFNAHRWRHITSKKVQIPQFIPKQLAVKRFIAARQAAIAAQTQASILVAHGPMPTAFGAKQAKRRCPETPFLAYAFNFTDLPKDSVRRLIAKHYQHPSKLVTFSNVERKLYADYFDIPIEKIDMLHWAVHAPKIDLTSTDLTSAPIQTGDYICALGSQARDYATLFAAMHALPHIKLVVVASKESIQHLATPTNVIVRAHIPLADAQNILAHSQFTVLPLRDSRVPCGHVTIVSAMFFQKAIIVTNSAGIYDYIQNEHTGLFTAPQDAQDLARKIAELWEDKAKTKALSQAGFAFANAHCTEKTVVNYFEDFLKHYINV